MKVPKITPRNLKNYEGCRFIVKPREKMCVKHTEEVPTIHSALIIPTSVNGNKRGYQGVQGSTGACGASGTSGTSGASGYVLEIEYVELFEYDDKKIEEVVDEFVRISDPSRSYNVYGDWYKCDNFLEAYEIIKVLPRLEK